MDRQGTVLVHHPDPERWVGTALPDAPDLAVVRARGTGVAEAAGPDGIPRLLGFVPLLDGGEGGDVYVSIGIPKEVALAGANRLLKWNLVTLVLVSLLAMVAAWYGGDAFVVRRVNRLAAGVAHELRNPLTVIDGRLHLLRMQLDRGTLPATEALAAWVVKLSTASERMKNIMQGLSTYSKPAKSEPTLLDVRELLAAAAELVAHQARTNDVTIRLDAPVGLPPVLGERSEMMQILLNLATNAVEAMAGVGGGLALRARVEPRGGEAPAPTQEAVVIDVADTGPGIPPEQLEKIWEAFYTTKAEGTGLGLSIVRGLAEKQPGAVLAVESAVGIGTTFRLTMPATSGPPSA